MFDLENKEKQVKFAIEFERIMRLPKEVVSTGISTTSQGNSYFSIVPNSIKILARTLVNVQIRKGNLKRQRCKVCKFKDTHAHHEDYSDPLKIMWLCSIHHAKRHKRLNSGSLTKK